MHPTETLNRCAELAADGVSFVLATLVEATGSTPADAGAKMIVTLVGLDAGTIGGGRVEAKAIDAARAMLAESADGAGACRLFDWSLKADVGMTCGGRVKILLERFGPPAWRIAIFGAGHVTQALAGLLVTLPCRVTCIDPREDWLAKLPPGIETLQTDNPPAEVVALPGDAQVLCMTRGHKSDLPVLTEVFRTQRDFPYLGVIGSRAKAAVLRKELAEVGVPEERIRFHCPVGLPIGSNNPAEIAVSIAAQLLEHRDKK